MDRPDAPDAALDGDDLDLASGLVMLVERALDRLPPGGVLEVRSVEPSVAHDLPAWCRFAGHGYLGAVEGAGGLRHRVRRGTAERWRLRPAAPPDRVPDRADPTTGFAPRGAAVEQGAPAYPFTLLERDRVWADEAATLYAQATASQWSVARDIPWAELPPLPDELEQAVRQIMTFLAENEFAALYVPAKFVPRIHPWYAEVALFLATQLADEARHIEAFTRRAQAGEPRPALSPPISAASTQLSLKTLLDQEDFTGASFLLTVLGEGTFLDLLRFIDEHAPDPVTAELVRRARNDEARHVRFGLVHVRHHLERRPDAADELLRAVRARASALAQVASVSPHLQDALAVLAAGSLAPAAVRRGVAAARALTTTMHENRVKRLLACGFTPAQAEEMSTAHTPNFM